MSVYANYGNNDEFNEEFNYLFNTLDLGNINNFYLIAGDLNARQKTGKIKLATPKVDT